MIMLFVQCHAGMLPPGDQEGTTPEAASNLVLVSVNHLSWVL